MSSHDASRQFIGYAYQARCALLMLLKGDDDASVSIEKLDDVSIKRDGSLELAQIKHHAGDSSIGDNDTDLWRTIKVWIDYIGTKPDGPMPIFTLLTTAKVKEGSLVEELSNLNERDNARILEMMRAVARASKSAANAPGCDGFLKLDDETAQCFVANIFVFGSSNQIADIDQAIAHELRFACPKAYVNDLVNVLIGWWCKQVTTLLLADDIKWLTHDELRLFINDATQRYSLSSLPVSEEIQRDQDSWHLIDSNMMFVKQLSIVEVGDRRMSLAKRDYVRAYRQRSEWMRRGNVFPGELDRYDDTLVEEWELLFSEIEDESEEWAEEEKKKAGRSLLGKVNYLRLPIRDKCGEQFIMRGSYQMLSDSMRVGWHPDFESILNDRREEDSLDR